MLALILILIQFVVCIDGIVRAPILVISRSLIVILVIVLF